VVVGDEKTSRERFALAREEMESYAVSYYETQRQSRRECGVFDRLKIRRELTETRVPELTAFANTEND
jgi:DNA polymerase I